MRFDLATLSTAGRGFAAGTALVAGVWQAMSPERRAAVKREFLTGREILFPRPTFLGRAMSLVAVMLGKIA